MLTPGSVLNLDWYRTPEGREMILSLMVQQRLVKRKSFGLLEKPNYTSHVTPDLCHYKLLLVGRSAVGKTSTMAKLAGFEVPTAHSDTPGLQTCNVYWPAKITQLNKVIMFQLQFWDYGENAAKKFDHILPVCTHKTDAIVFLFSFADKSTFDELPQQIARFCMPNQDACKLVLGTKFDEYAHSEVTQRDIRDFEHHWCLPVLRIRNIPDYMQHNEVHRPELNDVAPILNTICEHLWHRDVTLASNYKDVKS